MKKLLFSALAVVCLSGLSSPASAGYEHEFLNPASVTALELGTDTDSITCRVLADNVTNIRPIYIDCADFLNGGGDTITGTFTLDDGSGASPSFVFKDETDETATLSKADAGNLSVTTVAGDGLQILTGNFFIGNGTPGETINGEDLYVEGISEFDGTANFDGAVDLDGTITVGSTTLNTVPLTAQARGMFTICGDATTVNNNTVYYGASQVLTSSATAGSVVCDTTAVGNVTEATADEPVLAATAIYPLGMQCWNPDSGNTITYTLRSAAAAITPAISVSIADNILSGTTSATATTAIASGATVAVAVASTGNIGTVPFRCDISYAY